MQDQNSSNRPRWLRDLLRFLPLKAQFVLSGNVRDLQLGQTETGIVAPKTLVALLSDELVGAGYGDVIVYDPVNGIRTALRKDGAQGSQVLSSLGLTPGSDGVAPAGSDLLSEVLRRLSARPPSEPPVALLIDFAARLIVRPDALSQSETALFSRALVTSHQTRPKPYGTPPRPFMNSVIWIVEKEGDLPDWLVIDNPRLRHIPIAKPDHRYRRAMAQSLIGSLYGVQGASEATLELALDEMVDDTESLLLLDLNAIFTLCRTEGIHLI